MPLILNKNLEMSKLSQEDVSKVVTAKKKVLKEIESVVPVNTQIIRKYLSLIVDPERVLVVWIEGQTSHSIVQSLIQSKTLTLSSSVRAERGEEAQEGKCETRRGWLMKSEERNYLAKIINKGGYTKQEVFNVDERTSYWKEMPPRASIAREKAMPGFKASKNSLTLLLGADTASSFKLKPILIYHSKNPKVLKNYAQSTLPRLSKWTNKEKILLLFGNAPGLPGALMETYNEVNVVFLPANAATQNPFCSPWIKDDSSDGSGPSKWKPLEGSQNINIDRSMEEVIPALGGDFEGIKTSAKKVTAGAVEITRELELETEARAGGGGEEGKVETSGDSSMDAYRLPYFTEMESAPDEDAVMIVKRTANNLEYYMNLVDKEASGFERIDSSFERSSTVYKMLSSSLTCFRESVLKRKSQLMQQTSLLSYFKKMPHLPQPSATTTMISQQLLTSR
ncbi:hypothetical protein FD755_014629 [Muntiacus reevesi]|uniref:DDE-1 domain-containing protein n=1 Tax=Muntiacus reevesi TaxID=9886 RepID=A0A5N3XL60_MUNRE|nr:hypothetical protein FD755_014629 [Muntiacus reevesi]